MLILPLQKRLTAYLHKRGLNDKFEKQKKLLEANPYHPSLNLELLEPKRMRLFSFPWIESTARFSYSPRRISLKLLK